MFSYLLTFMFGNYTAREIFALNLSTGALLTSLLSKLEGLFKPLIAVSTFKGKIQIWCLIINRITSMFDGDGTL